MTPELAHQLANIVTVAVLCGFGGLIAGYGWGRETEQQAQADAVGAAEAARVDGFRVVFNAGVTHAPKKEEAQVGQMLSQR